MDTETREWLSQVAGTALLLTGMVALVLAANDLIYQYLRLAEAYARLALH